MSMTKEFPTLDVVTVATGTLVSDRGIDSVYDICGWAYVLADIAAKRAIVEVFEEAARDVDAIDYDDGADDEDWGAVSLLRDVVRLLAQPFAEHPDFDAGWRV